MDPRCKELNARRQKGNRKIIRIIKLQFRKQKTKIVRFVKIITCFLKETRGGTSQLVTKGLPLFSGALFMMKNGFKSKLPRRVVLPLFPLLLTRTMSLEFYIFLGLVHLMDMVLLEFSQSPSTLHTLWNWVPGELSKCLTTCSYVREWGEEVAAASCWIFLATNFKKTWSPRKELVITFLHQWEGLIEKLGGHGCKLDLVWWLAIILQYIQIPNSYVVHLKLTWCMSVISKCFQNVEKLGS